MTGPAGTAQPMGQAQREFFGKYKGQVVDNQDPLQKGRLQIVVPQVLGEAPVWALPCVPYAGSGLGLYTMPETGTGVWIEFEAGDPSYPIWTGCFWGAGDIDAADATPDVKFLRTRKATIRIDDTTGEILIENDSGTSITLTSDKVVIHGAAVHQEASGGRNTALTAASFKVNDGNLEVL
ncbi:phage baseplate assembly protein V [Roseospira navarrensis]|uniref:Baseplate assembly protein n=1 Tax=Roseospira navarrensis TaxID=140058 RepID=A0A7X1ZFK7_9PROT|nr:phage baseplate assembly protein V [Roseospira navarrensis]MQX37648.1 baseplate assembly protein [Roseospira navarrensis]